MHIDVGGCLAPTERGRRPQCMVQVVLAQIPRDKRRAVFNGGAHKGVLIHLRDSRLKVHLDGHRHLPPLNHDRLAMGYTGERRAASCDHGQQEYTRSPA